jgi:cytochrome c551/c552
MNHITGRLFMKRFVLLSLITCGCLIVGTMLWAAASGGEATFHSLKCYICHKPDRRSAGPSLPEIAKAYGGQQQQLAQYLQGESAPLIDLGRQKVMERQLEKTKEISAAERKDLADYILSFAGK